MLIKVDELMKYNEMLDVIYMTNDGIISQRSIRILKVNKVNLQAYCYLRGARRTFKIENILSFIPTSMKKRMVI